MLSTIEVLRKRPDFGSLNRSGIVVDNNDPLGLGRVKIRTAMLKGVPDDLLPWALPGQTGPSANAGGGVGSVNVPPIGAKLAITHTGNDPHSMQFDNIVPTADVSESNRLSKKNDPRYPHVIGHTDPAGNYFETDTREGNESILTRHVSGSSTQIDKDGNVNTVSSGKAVVSAKGDVTIVTDGDILIKAGGVVRINGSQVLINQGGNSAAVTATTKGTRPVIPQKRSV